MYFYNGQNVSFFTSAVYTLFLSDKSHPRKPNINQRWVEVLAFCLFSTAINNHSHMMKAMQMRVAGNFDHNNIMNEHK